MKFKEAMRIVNNYSIALNDPMKVANRFNKPTIRAKENANLEFTQESYEKFDETIEGELVDNSPKFVSKNPQGVIDSIVEEMTSVRLQQAIILSEIVGKPKSKTRKRRRF
ncbi:hypothetical protein D3C76_731110 [compost metagenome]